MQQWLADKELLKSNKAAGIEFVFAADGGVEYHLSIIKKKKNSVDIEKIVTAVKEPEVLQKELPSTLPVNIVISGKEVIIKKVERERVEHEGDLLHSVLPNADAQDFYIQAAPCDDTHLWVSLIRKNKLEMALEQVQSQNPFIHQVYLGPFVLKGIWQLLRDQPAEMQAGDHQLTFENGQVSGYNFSGSTSSGGDRLYLGGEMIDVRATVAFAAAFHYWYPGISMVEGAEKLTLQNKEEYTYRKIFSYSAAVVLALLFAALLANFLFYDHYRNLYQQLDDRVTQNQSQLKIIENLRKDINQKKELLNVFGTSGVSKTAFFADRIAKTVPRDIQLTNLFVYPLENKIVKGEKQMTFGDGEIVIEGETSESLHLNNWIKELKKYAWINEIKIVDYIQEEDIKAAQFQLSLKITNKVNA